MSVHGGYHDTHKGEEILDSCPWCRLPIYVSDSRRMVTLLPYQPTQLYHSACADSAKGQVLEAQLAALCQELRGCGYTVDLKVVRPVH